MRNIGVILLLVLMTSCATLNEKKVISGRFIWKHNNKFYGDELVLNEDGTFTFDIGTSCAGRWSYIAKDTILIKCNDFEFEECIAAGFMDMRERKIKVINVNKLKIPIEDWKFKTKTKSQYYIFKKVSAKQKIRKELNLPLI